MYMAPEIVQKNHKYTKSVDIWAIGIIMHQILTGNKHPIYDPKVDNRDILIEKLKTVKVVKADPTLSNLARNLFERLTSISMSQRYIAKDALLHPWITRKLSSDIPLTYYQRIQRVSNIRSKIFMFHFFAIISKVNEDKFLKHRPRPPM